MPQKKTTKVGLKDLKVFPMEQISVPKIQRANQYASKLF